MRITRNTWRMRLGLLLLASVLPACGSYSGPTGGSVKGGTIVDGIVGAPTSLLPELSGRRFDGEIQQAIWAPLFYTNDQAQIVPALASSIPSSENGGLSADAKTITIHLRSGLKWSDGTPLTAADVVFTIGLFQQAQSTPYGFQGNEIDSVANPDPNTVTITLKQPDASFLSNSLTNSAVFAPLPKQTYQGKTLEQLSQSGENDAPTVSSGPFKVKSRSKGDDVTLVRNPNYYLAPLPNLDQVIFKVFPSDDARITALQAGEIDVASLFDVSKLSTLNSLTKQQLYFHPSAIPNAFEALWLNQNSPILADPVVRLALAISVDPRVEIQQIWHGYATATCDDSAGTFAHEPTLITSDGLCAYGPDHLTYDPQKAAQLLDADGWIKDADGIRQKNGQPLTLRLSVNEQRAYRLQSEQIVQQAWSQLGVQVQIANFPDAASQNAALFPTTLPSSPAYDVAEIEWFASIDPDSRILWQSNQTPPQGGYNLAFYSNAQVDTWEQQQVATPDPTARAALFHNIHTQLLNDIPLIYLYAISDICQYCPQLHNYRPSGIGASETWNIQDWWIDSGSTADVPRSVAAASGSLEIPLITCHGS